MNEPNTPETPPAPAPTPPPAPSPEPEAPPATKIVVTGGKTEREIDLENRLAATEAAKRKAETDAAHAQDVADQLRAQLKPTPPTAPTKPTAKRASFGWWNEED